MSDLFMSSFYTMGRVIGSEALSLQQTASPYSWPLTSI